MNLPEGESPRWLMARGQPVVVDAGQPGRFIGIVIDITGRKDAEQRRQRSALLASELQIMQTLLDTSFAGYFDWNIPQGTEYLSPTFKRMFGYADEELPNVPESWQRLIVADDLPGVLEVFDRHVKSHGAEPYYSEVRYRHKDGSTIWVICAGLVVEWTSTGAPVRLVGCHIDITRLKQLEEERARESAARLTEKETELKEAQRLAHVGNWYWDPRTDAVMASEELLRIFGLDPATEILPGFREQEGRLFTPANWERLHRTRQETLRTGIGYALDIEALRAGDPIWVTTRGEAVRNAAGEILGLRGTVQDISERKRAEEELNRHRHHLQELVDERTQALAKQELLWRTVMTLLPVGVWLADETGTIVFGNEAAQRIWAGARYVGPKQFGAYKAWWNATGQPLDAEDWAINRALRRGETSLDEVLDIECFDGSRKTILNSAIPLRNDAEEITGAIVVNQDITELKQFEQELSQAKEAAEAASRAKSTFLANMSHEIRTPMNAIIGLTHRLQREDPTPYQRERLDKISGAADHLLAIINDILDISKVEAGKLTLETADFRLETMMQGINSLIGEKIQAKGLRFSVRMTGLPPVLRGDATRLTQMLLNYLGNALKFTEQGSITLSGQVRSKKARPTCCCASRSATPESGLPQSSWPDCSRPSNRPTVPPRANTAARAWDWRSTAISCT